MFAMVRAHWIDVGGMSTGFGAGPTVADPWVEGLQLDQLKIYEAGKLNETLYRVLKDNIRFPESSLGDMKSQMAACRLAARRMDELFGKYGRDTVLEAIAGIFDETEAKCRNVVSQLAVVEVGRVDDDVVEVLAGDRLMVGDDDVARGEAVPAVALHGVGDDDAEVGDEMRHAADVLADQLAGGVDQRGAEVAHLVDHHVVGGALQIDRHLIGDRGERIADDFERDGIERGGHRRAPR